MAPPLIPRSPDIFRPLFVRQKSVNHAANKGHLHARYAVAWPLDKKIIDTIIASLSQPPTSNRVEVSDSQQLWELRWKQRKCFNVKTACPSTVASVGLRVSLAWKIRDCRKEAWGSALSWVGQSFSLSTSPMQTVVMSHYWCRGLG